MKYRNKIKRLRIKQKDYDNMAAEDPKLRDSYYRPGSVKKS